MENKVENKSVNQINFDYNGKHYCLEYTRESVKQMEAAGFNMNDMGDKPATRIEQLWQGAFLANHPNEPESKIREIYKSLKRTAEDAEPEYDEDGHEIDLLAQTLADMITEAVDELTGRGNTGNVTWKVT